MIRLHTLGTAGLEKDGGREVRSVLSQPKRLALLAYLTIATPRGFHRRDSLLGRFWPELDATRGRAALSQALYYLRRSLGARAVPSRGKEEVGVDPERVWCDAVALDEAMEAGDPEGLRAAVELYRGELLPGFFLSDAPDFERWLEDERARLRGRAADAAWTLCESAEEAGRAAEAVEWGRKSLALSAYDEAQLRRLIELLDRVGDRAGAVRVYEEVAERLAREYELEPSPETQERIAAVRRRVEPRTEVVAPGAVRPGAAAPGAVTAGGMAPETPPRPARERQPAEGRGDGAAAGPGRRPRRLWLGGVAGAAAAVGITAALLFSPPPTSSADTALPSASRSLDPTRVAVLPLENLGPGGEAEQMADGLTAELISRLARLRDLRVIPWTSVRRYRGSAQSAGEIGRELNVGTIVEGTAQTSGDTIRITVSLTKVGSGDVAWSRSYDTGLGEILGVRRAVAEDVALELKLSGRVEAAQRRAEAWPDGEVAEEYLLGRAGIGQGDPQSFLDARDHFLRAVALDSSFADAWAGLATSYTALARGGMLGGAEPWQRARRAAETALAIDPELPEAHAALAIIGAFADWDPALAERHFDAALELDPSDAATHMARVAFLRNQGRFEEALASIRLARDLEPRRAEAVNPEAMLLYLMKRPEEAIELVDGYLSSLNRDEVIELSDPPDMGGPPPHFWIHFTKALAQVALGDYEAALESLDEASEVGPRPDAQGLRGYVYARLGRSEQARQILAELARSGDDALFPSSPFHMAIIHIGLDEHDRAIALLEQAAAEKTRLIGLLSVEPMFDPLRGDPRFRALLRQVGLAERPARPPADSPAVAPETAAPPLRAP